MSLRQVEKDVESEIGHVEEKNVVVEVGESVIGGESEKRLGAERKVSVRGRRKLVKDFAQLLKTIEQGGGKRKPVGRAREKAQKLSESQEWLKRKVVKLEKALMAEKQVSEGMKSHLKVWKEKSKDDHEGKQKMHETWRKPRRTSRSSTNSSEASSWENRGETKTDTSRRSEVRDMMDGMRRLMMIMRVWWRRRFR
uniref:Uncharacterized protein n=1 Tax=Caenorhabditis japonica TaxID=281687 RepID=A0A2Q4TBA4_CAEJA